ncbi:MAG: DNA repair protein RecO [Erysipelothrix sp.]|nr:DNA repair protein RecO [Erysipelothrix sp.]
MSKNEQRVKGIVLKQIDYKDNDVIINVLSQNGKLYSMYARGIKKITSKNANAVLVFSYSDFEYFHNQKGLHTLKTAKTIKNYFNSFKDYNKIIVAFMLLDVVNDVMTMTINESINIYKLLSLSLENINTLDENLLLAFFLVSIMKDQGITLIVDSCAVCDSEKVNYISIENGGFICHNCLENNNESIYDLEILKLFRIINKISLDDLSSLDFSKNNYKQILEIIYSFYNNYTGLRIRNFEKLIMA